MGAQEVGQGRSEQRRCEVGGRGEADRTGRPVRRGVEPAQEAVDLAFRALRGGQDFLPERGEREAIRCAFEGFRDVRLIDGSVFGGVELTRTAGQHGSDEAIAKLGARLGEVSGVVFRAPGEETLYLAGDTVWNGHVRESIDKYAPDVVIVNCGDARIDEVGPIIMNKEDVREVCRAAPEALVIATHMEAVNHAVLTRAELKRFLEDSGLQSRVAIPLDGETVCP